MCFKFYEQDSSLITHIIKWLFSTICDNKLSGYKLLTNKSSESSILWKFTNKQLNRVYDLLFSYIFQNKSVCKYVGEYVY